MNINYVTSKLHETYGIIDADYNSCKRATKNIFSEIHSFIHTLSIKLRSSKYIK